MLASKLAVSSAFRHRWARFASTAAAPSSYKLVVIGGGAGGLAVSSTLAQKLGKDE
ncbi:hypothetical protein IWW55_007102, partial [Coemansia sp. RSA 2706]